LEALAFQGAAGYSGSLFFCRTKLSESLMRLRLPPLIAATALLAACGNNDQTDQTQNVDEYLSAENIVANDVTAIDAVTADAANMAADVNYMEFDNALANAPANASATARSRRSSAPADNTAANSDTNAL
jgi:hypothetical protein